jgi:hypothetical protein
MVRIAEREQEQAWWPGDGGLFKLANFAPRKPINEKNQSAYYGWYYRLCNQTLQVPIQFIFKLSSISKKARCGLAGIISLI